MKRNMFKNVALLFLPLLVISCVDNVPQVEELPRDAVSFEYRIEGDYALDYYIDSDITFQNTSPTQGEAVWDFGDGNMATGNTVVHAYDVAGTYDVKLTIAGITKSQVIMIADIKPLLSINPIEGGICEVNTTSVSFSLEVPNPKNKKLTYKWTFPEGTKNLAGDSLVTSEEQLPGELIFGNVGSQTVRLQVTMDGRALEEGVVNVPVGYNKPVPTLYYAVQGGHIMALKIINDSIGDMKVNPFDLGLSSGQHPLNLLFKDSSLYVIDCGAQFTYANEAVQASGGDGKISVIAKDGSKLETMISNAGQAAFEDPFFGCIEGEDLYFVNRITGMVKVPLSTRNAVYSASEYPYYAQRTTLGYYNSGWTYSTFSAGIAKINGLWYWCNYAPPASGIFRFKDSDILKSTTGADAPAPKSGILLPALTTKSFAYSSVSNKFAFTLWNSVSGGFYVASEAELDEASAAKSVVDAVKVYKKNYNGLEFTPNSSGSPSILEGTTAEPIGICQIAYDEINDCMYFAYRNSHNDVTCAPTGIYRYSFATDAVDLLLEGPNVFGLVVNNTPSKLF